MARARRKGWGKAHMAWVRSFARKRHNPRRRRRSYRRNAYPIGGYALNKRRRRSYRRNPMMNRRRRYRRNPAIMGVKLPPLRSVMYAAGGFVGVPMAEGFLGQWLPLSITSTTIGKYAVRVGATLGLAYLGRMVLGREAGMMIGIGGGAYVLTTAIREFAPTLLPSMGAYAPIGMGAYRPALAGMGAPAFGARNTAGFAAAGASNVVAARFRRFQ